MSEAIDSELFDQLHCGTVILTVPLKHDTIRIGVRDAPHAGELRVCKQGARVTVERCDGTPLQVAIVHEGDALTGSTVSLAFRRPVNGLRLRRHRSGWVVEMDEAYLGGYADLKQLLDTIGAFGAAKQSAAATLSGSPRTARSGSRPRRR